LSGDLPANSDAAPKANGKSEKAQRYTASAKRENHGRTTDLLPRRMLPLTMWYALGLILAAGLLFGFSSQRPTEAVGVSGMAELLDASKGGSLAGWFSSMAFLLSAVASVLIYSVRRHKVDDYRGRYRLWLWCALAWVAMSIDATANLHAPLSRAMAKATGWSALPDSAAWWIGIWGTILTILSLRLWFEMRECRIAMIAMLAVDALWITGLSIDFGWMPQSLMNATNASLVAVGCRLVAQVTLLMAIGLYARFVLLDAEGLLKARTAKAKREKATKKPKAEKATDLDRVAKVETSSGNTRIDAGHKSTNVAGNYNSSSSAGANSNSSSRYAGYDDLDEDDGYANRRAKSKSYDDEESEEDDEFGDGNRKLSKAERKRIRKQMRRQQRDDER
jgi:hypothetical protein